MSGLAASHFNSQSPVFLILMRQTKTLAHPPTFTTTKISQRAEFFFTVFAISVIQSTASKGIEGMHCTMKLINQLNKG